MVSILHMGEQMKAMSTKEQSDDVRYYDWTGNKARKKQRLRNKKAKRTIRRKARLEIRFEQTKNR